MSTWPRSPSRFATDVLIHQVLGALKPGDIPAEVRVKAIDKLTENYFVPGTYIQAGYPIEMRYAGPREALLHAVFRQNFGCSHLVIGRDHAGVGSYYGPFDAQHIFDTLPPGSLVTQPLKIDVTFYCYKCGGMATARTCPHGAEHRLEISGTKLRAHVRRRGKDSRRVQPPRSGRSAAGILSRAEAVTQKIYITRSQQGGILRMPTFVHTEKCDGCKGGEYTVCMYVCPNDLMKLDTTRMKAFNQEPEQCWECQCCVEGLPAAGHRGSLVPGLGADGRRGDPDAHGQLHHVDHQVPRRRSEALQVPDPHHAGRLDRSLRGQAAAGDNLDDQLLFTETGKTLPTI